MMLLKFPDLESIFKQLDVEKEVMYTKIVIKLPRSRGDSGALYLQSAIAGVMTSLELICVRLCPW